MQAHIKVLLLGAAALVATPVFSAEVQVPAAAGTQRTLLQPPKMTIASPITDRFAVRGLFYMPSINTDVRYDSSTTGRGTLVNGEDTLGLEDQLKQGSVDMQFRILERHRIRADFYKMTRTGDQVIDQQIQYGNDTFLVNDRVVSRMDLRKLGLTYTYSFLRSEKWELAGGLALHLLQLDASLEAPARFVRENQDSAGPFATLSVDGTWRVTRRFSLNLSGSYLGASVDDVEGSYKSWHGDVQFRARPNLAFGVGYSDTQFKLDSRDPEFAGYFNLHYKGPEAFVRVSF